MLGHKNQPHTSNFEKQSISVNGSPGPMKGGRRTRSTRCWRRARSNGTRYTVCNKSKGQKGMRKSANKGRKSANKGRKSVKKGGMRKYKKGCKSAKKGRKHTKKGGGHCHTQK